MVILSVKRMTKRFGGLVAISDLNLEIKLHSIHSIIGPNGAGKTTFFNCLTGFTGLRLERFYLTITHS